MNLEQCKQIIADLDIEPIDPSEHMCEKCNERKAMGTIGSLLDKTYQQWVCMSCYKKIFPDTQIDRVDKFWNPDKDNHDKNV